MEIRLNLPEEVPGTEQADQADDDQVQGDNEVKQARHQQNENAGDQGQQRAQGDVKTHACLEKKLNDIGDADVRTSLLHINIIATRRDADMTQKKTAHEAPFEN
jgi:hypothetical protein